MSNTRQTAETATEVSQDPSPERDVLKPLRDVRFVPREDLRANDYNPNKVNEENLRLLEQSILANGWTLPIVVRPDLTIIDGFHRWTVSGREPLLTLLGGMVPVVIVEHADRSGDIYGTITHNRARGTHLLEPMKAIVTELLEAGRTIPEITKETGMKAEEVFRLANFTREDFLARMTAGTTDYGQAEFFVSRG